MGKAPESIAIVGIGCRLAGGVSDPAQFWSFLTDGRSDVREVPAERWEPYLRRDPRNAAVLTCGGETAVAAVPVIRVVDAVAEGSDGEPSPVDPHALAYVLFTSGSTGEPKGVELTHDAVMNTVEFVDHFGLGPTDRSLALASLEADMSVLEIFAILRAGGAVVVVDEQHRRDPDAWAELIEAHCVTFLNWMPGWLDMLLEAGGGRLSTLRVVLLGGDWVRPELIRGLREAAPAVRAAGLGGATETAVHGTIREVDDRNGGTIRIPAPPWHFSGHDGAPTAQIPAHQGEQNAEILKELGYTDDQMRALLSCGALIEPSRGIAATTGSRARRCDAP